MLKDLFHTALTGGAVTGLTATLGTAAILASLKDPRAADPIMRAYGAGILKAAGVRHEAHGLERVPQRPAVFVCNHQSHFDALLLLNYLPRLRFVAKKELYRIPIFGQAIRATGNIRVDRSNSQVDRETLDAAAVEVRERTSVIFFAEGTRTYDGVLRPFKKGAAALALRAGVPVVPLAVAGTRHILPKNTKWIHAGQRAVLLVGEPIDTRGMDMGDRDRLTVQAREAVAALLAEANRQVGEAS